MNWPELVEAIFNLLVGISGIAVGLYVGIPLLRDMWRDRKRRGDR